MRYRIWLATLVLLLGGAGVASAQPGPPRQHEPNTRVPAGALRHAASAFPDRIVASPLQDAVTGFSVAWRTDGSVQSPLLEIVVAGDSPDMGVPRQVRGSTRALATENGLAHHHAVALEHHACFQAQGAQILGPGFAANACRHGGSRGGR